MIWDSPAPAKTVSFVLLRRLTGLNQQLLNS